MKKYLILLLILSLALSLCACSREEAVTFYYVRDKLEYQFGTPSGVMVGESRTAAGHVNDLRYLLILYFHGPVSEYLESPFPSGTSLSELEQEEDSLRITLSGIVSTMEGADLTLACACLARTCFDLTDVESVTVTAEALDSISVTIGRDSLLLMDDSAANFTE